MPLLPGTQLGPYEVLTQIGSGGMGVVYRARDPRLHREVAIKVIRKSQTQDGERLMQRLEQEARAIAKISHPNILQVFDVGQHEGAPFLVMELLLGETLRERLDRGPLQTRKATDLLIQVAHGLAAAHEQGIYHRDLKPENVFITPDERVKILDFGLAKPAPIGEALGDEATGAHPVGRTRLTEDGAVMGTVGYLSPEQIRSGVVDARSDIFALGAMFYEMLLGTMPFQGETSVETMTAILRQEVSFPVRDGLDLPPALEHLIRTCLEKEPGSRFQTAWDLSLALQALRAQSSSTMSGSAPILPPEPWLPAAWRKLLLSALVGGALVLVSLGLFLHRNLPLASQAEWTSLTARPGLTATARFMPDGGGVVYSSALGSEPPAIQSIRIGQVIPKPLDMVGQVMAVGDDGAILFVQSPERVHPGAAAAGMLSEFLVDGTEAKPLLERTESADRSPDGRKLAVVRVDAGPDGRQNHLECPPGHSLHTTSGWLYSPRLSPDGTLLSVLESQGPDSWVARVRVLDLQGQTRFLSDVLEIQSQAWAPSGKELLLTRTPGVLEALDLRGHLRPLLRGPNLLHLYDVAADGRLLVSSYQDRTEVFVATEGQPLSTVPLSAWAARLPADGTQVLFTGPGPKGTDMTYLLRRDTEALRPIASGKILGAAEDGSVVLLKRQHLLYRVPTGPGSELAVPLGDLGTVWRAALLPDGRRIAVVAAAPGKDFQLHVLDPATTNRLTIPGSEGIRQVVALGPETLVGDALDGHLRSFTLDGKPGVKLKGALPGDIPLRLHQGGDQLFVQEAYTRPGSLRIWTIGLRDGQRRIWRTLSFSVLPGLRSAQVLSITPDGHSVAYFTWAQPNDLFTVGGLLEGRSAGR